MVVSRNNEPAWTRLLSFPRRCFCTPARGGKRWSLAALVYNQVSQESTPSVEPRATRPPQKRNNTELLASRVSSKFEEGNYKGAVRLVSSEDGFAEHSTVTLEALKAKHPSPSSDSFIPALDPATPLPLTVDIATILKVISSFPNGSGGGSDGLLPQHLKDLTSPSAGDGGASLLSALVSLVTLVLEGKTPPSIRPFFFEARLTALTKKSGGVRPIAVGCTLRRLISKCACLHALASIPDVLAPHQLGFGIAAGVEAAIHASRVYLAHLPSNKALVKVDFQNAFNSIRRDKLLEAVKGYIPDLLPYVHSAYSAPSVLLWDSIQLSSAEGIQQGDPLGPMLFCLGIHDLVSSLSSEFNVFYLDDGTIGGDLQDLENDLARIESVGKSLGLVLNINKSEVISHNKSAVSSLLSSLPDLQFTDVEHAQLLGSPLGGAAMHLSLQEQLHQLKLIGERLCYLSMHDAITILRHSFSILNSCTSCGHPLPSHLPSWKLGTTY